MTPSALTDLARREADGCPLQAESVACGTTHGRPGVRCDGALARPLKHEP